MIFVSVGAQMPFDRLVSTVDQWAGLRRQSDIFAQIGQSGYLAQHIKTTQFVNANEFRRLVERARIVVSHAGMGSIITALEFGKPMIVMPRRGDLGETRNDHQVATANHFSRKGHLTAAFTEKELIDKLDQSMLLSPSEKIDAQAPLHLVTTIRAFLERRTVIPRPLDQLGP